MNVPIIIITVCIFAYLLYRVCMEKGKWVRKEYKNAKKKRK